MITTLVEGRLYANLISDTVFLQTYIPNIQKLRDRLKKLVLDRDNANQQWAKAHKAQYTPGVNMQQMSVKADSMKEELDQAQSRMELCKVGIRAREISISNASQIRCTVDLSSLVVNPI